MIKQRRGERQEIRERRLGGTRRKKETKNNIKKERRGQIRRDKERDI